MPKPQPTEGWQTGRTSCEGNGVCSTELVRESAALAVNGRCGILELHFIALTSNIPRSETTCSSVSSQTWELEATYLNTRLNGILSQRRLVAIKAGGTSHMQLHLSPSESLVNCSLPFSSYSTCSGSTCAT